MTRTHQVAQFPCPAAALSPVKGFKRLGSSRGGKRRETLKSVDQGITKGSIRRLARRAGVRRISSLVYDDARNALVGWLRGVLKDCALIAENGRRYTVTPSDVVMALKRRGTTLWGFGEAHAFLRPDKKLRPISRAQVSALCSRLEKAVAQMARVPTDTTAATAPPTVVATALASGQNEAKTPLLDPLTHNMTEAIAAVTWTTDVVVSTGNIHGHGKEQQSVVTEELQEIQRAPAVLANAKQQQQPLLSTPTKPVEGEPSLNRNMAHSGHSTEPRPTRPVPSHQSPARTILEWIQRSRTPTRPGQEEQGQEAAEKKRGLPRDVRASLAVQTCGSQMHGGSSPLIRGSQSRSSDGMVNGANDDLDLALRPRPAVASTDSEFAEPRFGRLVHENGRIGMPSADSQVGSVASENRTVGYEVNNDIVVDDGVVQRSTLNDCSIIVRTSQKSGGGGDEIRYTFGRGTSSVAAAGTATAAPEQRLPSLTHQTLVTPASKEEEEESFLKEIGTQGSKGRLKLDSRSAVEGRGRMESSSRLAADVEMTDVEEHAAMEVAPEGSQTMSSTGSVGSAMIAVVDRFNNNNNDDNSRKSNNIGAGRHRSETDADARHRIFGTRDGCASSSSVSSYSSAVAPACEGRGGGGGEEEEGDSSHRSVENVVFPGRKGPSQSEAFSRSTAMSMSSIEASSGCGSESRSGSGPGVMGPARPKVLRQVLNALRQLLDSEPGLTWIPRAVSDVAALCPGLSPATVASCLRLFAEEATASAAAATVVAAKPSSANGVGESGGFWIPSLMIDEDNETFYLFQPDVV